MYYIRNLQKFIFAAKITKKNIIIAKPETHYCQIIKLKTTLYFVLQITNTVLDIYSTRQQSVNTEELHKITINYASQ